MSRQEALRFRLPGDAHLGLWVRFEALGRRAALVGPEGTGKTTLLGELAARLQDEGLRVLRQQVYVERPLLDDALLAELSAAPTRCAVVLDGLDLLGTLSRWRLRYAARGAGALLVASHRTTWLPTLHHHAVSDALLLDLIDELVDGRDEALTKRVLDLLRAHNGNARLVLRALYDDAAFTSQERSCPVAPP